MYQGINSVSQTAQTAHAPVNLGSSKFTCNYYQKEDEDVLSITGAIVQGY